MAFARLIFSAYLFRYSFSNSKFIRSKSLGTPCIKNSFGICFLMDASLWWDSLAKWLICLVASRFLISSCIFMMLPWQSLIFMDLSNSSISLRGSRLGFYFYSAYRSKGWIFMSILVLDGFFLPSDPSLDWFLVPVVGPPAEDSSNLTRWKCVFVFELPTSWWLGNF